MNDHEQDDLFARARGVGTPTDSDRKRVRAALTRRLGVAVGATVGATTAKAAAGAAAAGVSTTSAGLSGLVMVKAGIVVAVALAVGVAAGPVRRSLSARQNTRSPWAAAQSVAAPVAAYENAASPEVVAPRPDPVVPPPPPAAAQAPLAHVTPSSPAVARDPIASRVEPSDPVVAPRSLPASEPPLNTPSTPTAAPQRGAETPEEVALMTEIQLALRSGDDARVLALVREHEGRFPASAWVPEREGARVLARCNRAEAEEAHRLGRSFVQRYPLSPLGARVRAACGISGE